MDEIEEILTQYRSIAVVGASPDPSRPSHIVADYLQRQGYHVIPVNPRASEVLGGVSYPDLASVPPPVEIVDIFRPSGEVMPIVEQAIAIGAKTIWMQEGVINEQAAQRARQAGLRVVMDRCLKKEHQRLLSQGK